MSAEKQGSQLSFLNPPIHNLGDYASFTLPEVKTPTPTSVKQPKLAQNFPPEKSTQITLRERYFWHELPATPGQLIDIARKSLILGLSEPHVSNEIEARDMQYFLKGALNRRDAEHKSQRKLKKIKVRLLSRGVFHHLKN